VETGNWKLETGNWKLENFHINVFWLASYLDLFGMSATAPFALGDTFVFQLQVMLVSGTCLARPARFTFSFPFPFSIESNHVANYACRWYQLT
jgi:hypothetical protein